MPDMLEPMAEDEIEEDGSYKVVNKESESIEKEYIIPAGTFAIKSVKSLIIDKQLFKFEKRILTFNENNDMSLCLGDGNYKEIKIANAEINYYSAISTAYTTDEINYIDESGTSTRIKITEAEFANLYKVLEDKVADKVILTLSDEFKVLVSKIETLEKSGMLKLEYDSELKNIGDQIKALSEELNSFLNGPENSDDSEMPEEEIPDMLEPWQKMKLK